MTDDEVRGSRFICSLCPIKTRECGERSAYYQLRKMLPCKHDHWLARSILIEVRLGHVSDSGMSKDAECSSDTTGSMATAHCTFVRTCGLPFRP